jgi:hypothetical protein
MRSENVPFMICLEDSGVTTLFGIFCANVVYFVFHFSIEVSNELGLRIAFAYLFISCRSFKILGALTE